MVGCVRALCSPFAAWAGSSASLPLSALSLVQPSVGLLESKQSAPCQQDANHQGPWAASSQEQLEGTRELPKQLWDTSTSLWACPSPPPISVRLWSFWPEFYPVWVRCFCLSAKQPDAWCWWPGCGLQAAHGGGSVCTLFATVFSLPSVWLCHLGCSSFLQDSSKASGPGSHSNSSTE